MTPLADQETGPMVKKVLIGLLILVVGLLAGGAITRAMSVEVLGSARDERNTQIIEAIQREEQVVLLSLGVQGIAEERVVTTIFGKQLPGSGRVLFLQYSYNAKLGIEGSEVTISQLDENRFQVSIPEFIFIGHDDVQFQTAVEDNGVLSWVTPEIDTAQVISEILDGDAQFQQVVDNRLLLEDQARAFYTGILEAIDPEVQVVYEFRGVGR